MANMKVTGTQQAAKAAEAKPQEAAKAVKNHLNKIHLAGLGENGKDIIRGATAGAIAGAVVLPLLPIGLAAGAAAGAGAAAIANKIEEKREDKQIKDSVKQGSKAFSQKAEKGPRPAAAKPAAEQDTSKLQGALKTAGAAVIGGALLGLPGVALGAMLASDFVTGKAKEAFDSINDFMTKNADKMVAKTPGKVE